LALSGLQKGQTGLDQVIRHSSALLGEQQFYTVGFTEARAWTINAGATAVEAAAKIHSEIAAGFTRAEVIASDDFLRLGSEEACRTAGKIVFQPKDYRVRDGDIITFKHHKANIRKDK
jgi:ribosome-binding ATPase